MLKSISWGDYWMAVLILATIYYFLLILSLRRKGAFVKQPGSGNGEQKRKWQVVPEQSSLFSGDHSTQEPLAPIQPPQASDYLMPLVHEFVSEVKDYIESVAQRSFVKEEIITGLQMIAKQYKQLAGSEYYKSINDFMTQQCEEQCSTHLSADDIRRVWSE